MAERRDLDERVSQKRGGTSDADDAAIREDRELPEELGEDRGKLRGGARREEVPGSGRDVDPNREP